MLKILLINPPSPWLISDRDMPPRGILLIASNLRANGFEVQFVDLAGMKEDQWFLPRGDIYMISTTSPQYIYAKKICLKIRGRDKKAKIVLAGYHPSILPERTMKETGCDAIIVGEGEEASVQLAKSWKSGVITGGTLEDINRYPMPAYDMIDADDYFEIGTNSFIGGKKEGYIQTARGCPFDCAFCGQARMTKRKVRYYDIDKVEQEVDYLIQNYHIDQVYVFDDTLVLLSDRVKEFCRMMKKKGLKWHCLSRADRAELELYKIMYDAGCRGICYGTESGSDKMLKLMDKRTTAKQNHDAVVIAKEAGIKVRCQMIVGFPGETDKTVKETAEFIKNTPADVFGVHVFIPFPGCQVWDNPDKFGVSIDRNTDFSNYHTIGRKGELDVVVGDYEKIKGWKQFLLDAVGKHDIAHFANIKKK